jgi:hypothetical protein
MKVTLQVQISILSCKQANLASFSSEGVYIRYLELDHMKI